LISIVLEPKGIDTRFVHHLLRCTAFQEEFYRWGHGIVADLWTTRWSDMKNIRVRVPDLDTQKTIADFLDKETARIDQLIEKKQRLVELLGERVQGLLSEVVTGAFAKGHSRQTTGNAFLPQLPAHWQIATLKRLARVRGGFTLGRKLGQGVETVATPYLRVANVQAGYVDLANVATVEATKSEFLRYALRSGDVLMIEGGDNDKLGRAAVWLGEPKGAMHQNHVFAVRPKKSVYAWWIVMCSNSAYGRDYFFLNSRQSTNLASVSKTRAERFPIPLPPPSEVTELTERWRREEGELTSITGKVETSIDRLKEYRSALITAAVTGQIDVSRWGQTGEGDKRLDQIQAEMAG
jgi:type I restriction enzyme S subunit